jgi:nucleoside-diphosphate-sugar epimerase
MKFVITGALGHIGSSLIRYLPSVYPGCSIIMIDDMSVERYCSLFDLPAAASYRFIEGDVRKLDLVKLISGADLLVHLAAITDAASSFGNAELVEQNNFESTRAVAQACVEASVAMIFPSSTSVYGVQEGEVDEDCPIDELKPQSPYAETKLREEAFIAKLVRENSLRAAICRFGTIYGVSPGMRFHTAVNKFCWQAVSGIPLTVWRTAYDQYRPYLALDDATRAVRFIVDRELYSPNVVNIVSNNHTVREVVDSIRLHVPDCQVDLVDNKIMNQLSYKVRNTKLTSAGFIPQGQLAEGVAATIKLIGRAGSLRRGAFS